MLILVTILILLVAAGAITLWRILQPTFGYSWLLASISAIVAWICTLIWVLRLPIEIAPTLWQPATLFATSPALYADGTAWAFALALTTVCLAAVMTMPLRAIPVNPLIAAGILTLTAIGVIAVTAHNPLTLLIAWAALDLAELAIILRTFETEQQNERGVFSFAMRSAGTVLLLWANVYSVALGVSLDFKSALPQVSVFLLLAAAFKLGVLPVHLPYAGAPVLRRGFGSIIRLVAAAASLTLLTRLPQSAFSLKLAPWLFLLIGATALFAAWRWFRTNDEMAGRPYWIIGMGSLAVLAALGGNQIGSAAFGIALLLIGALAFLYSHASPVTRLLVLFVLFTALGLPFTLTASAWAFGTAIDWWLWPLPISAHVLLIAGFARFVLMDKPALPEEQSWQRIIYPSALGLLTVISILLGVWGWEGALKFGGRWLSLIILLLTGGLIWLRARIKTLSKGQVETVQTQGQTILSLEQLSAGAWSIYHGMRRISDLTAQTFEGEGGILWTLLLLVLLITLVQGAH